VIRRYGEGRASASDLQFFESCPDVLKDLEFACGVPAVDATPKDIFASYFPEQRFGSNHFLKGVEL
jgi:hypothetical protein